MKKTSSFLYGLILIVGLGIFTFAIGLIFIGEFTLPDERTYTDLTVEKYSDGWERIRWDGSAESITLPGNYEPEGSHEFVLRKKLDVWDDRDCFLSFNSNKQDVDAYIGDELRYSFSTKSTRVLGSNTPGTMVFIPLHPSDEGKTIKIVLSGDNNYSGVLDEFIVGTQVGIVMYVYNRERYTLLLTLFLLVLGVIAFIIGVSVKIAYRKTLPLFFIGWAMICASLWSLAETDCRQFFVPNFSLLSYMTYLSLIMLPYTVALYFDRLQEGRYRALYMGLAVLEEFSAGIAILLQFFNDTDLSGILPIAFVSIGLTMITYIVTVIPDIIHGRVNSYWLEFIGICGAIIMGIMQMCDYAFLHPTKIHSLYLIIGLLFLIIMAYFRALKDIRNTEREMYAAVQAQESSTAFMTRMSHEMRTPINAILGMNKMILRESKDEHILEYSRDVNSAGNYLLGIVNEVLDLAKVSAGKIEIVPEDYDLMDMIRECYSLARPRAKASRLSFEVDMSDVLPARLRGDRERIIQIITNLLTNAVKYTPEGRITLSVQGKISEGKLLLIVTVTDTGIGVAEENIPYLFDTFTRVGEFNKKRIEGTGLGLTITKQLVDLMGGTISVESELGKGSSFIVMIPQEIRSVEPCGMFSMGPNGDRRVADRHEVFDVLGRILVVDDVAINLRVFSVLLSNTDITVDTAISGTEALEKIGRNKYDIIFIDHLMPGMDGIELKRLIDSMEDNPNSNTPLVMQTANAVVGAKEEYERLGFTDYIAKPIKEEELRKLIRKYII
ncbi:ATP-binding response regulator [Pseudobutyrivibrio xylanivorans]|uniref:Circadian input-output histidine kinase CikA n=1 Tax=Pseudobutyrivibrio xylanivorans DSM 14809 TaxID=1123012 RepID=A0A1M6AT87_PSEXY|nr:ATP-binding protein [Pseudobutyrivibrio xylanivorans]SHI39433.1 Signal transduction histidine kinase [Pseudobutyrivibrio xylanivorans DSM 14809]